MFGFGKKKEIAAPEQKGTLTLDGLIQKLEAASANASGVSVTPENCMASPTVHAIVTAVRNRFISLPVYVYQKTGDKRTVRTKLPNHPVQKLLDQPNDWQTQADFFGDAVSGYIRYGRFTSFKARARTGPIRQLIPLEADGVTLDQDTEYNVTVKINRGNGVYEERPFRDVLHVRSASRDFLNGNSPVEDVKEAIGLEIAAEKFGASFFGNGAMPGIIFSFLESYAGFETDEQRSRFLQSFNEAYSGRGRFKGMLLPPGMAPPTQMEIANDRAQFLETRKLQRNIIAGAFGVPPHLVGDLERGTFSNIEHQSLEFTQAVILPVVRTFEKAMERDLLTPEDRRNGLVIRFNMDGALRGDFKSRQEGLAIQRQNGVINANEWREQENMNPITEEEGGEAYYQQGPSGQTTEPTNEAGNDEQD